jgi:hypothetical protein
MDEPQYHLHDGYVDGIVVSGKEAKLLLRSVSGDTFEMSLNGVEHLKADDFREGNIILRVVLHKGGECSADLLHDLYAPSEYDSGAADFLARLQVRVREEKMVLVEIMPSYGCSLLALCKDARIVPTSAQRARQ